MKEVKLIYFVFCLLAVAGILACGGGGGSGDSTSGSTQFTSIGTITGFGSVYVGETKFETKNADIFLDDELGSQDDLRIGMVVTVKGTYNEDDEMGDADTIEYDKELEGPISSIEEVNSDIKELMVMCKKVIVEKGETKFENTSFEDLAEYMFIEVSGYPDSSGAIRATYIEKIYDVYDPEEDEVEIEGVVENWNEEDMTFEIEGCVVYYSEDTEFDGFSPSELEDGLYVEVEGKFEAPNEIYATEIELEDDDQEWNEGETVHIEGYIENVESKYEFEVKGYDYPVRVSMDTILENGSLDDIVEGNKVKVEGEIEDEYLWAEKIYFYLDYTEDFATALTTDDEDNVYVTGYSKGENTDFDYMTVKYDSDGKKLWARRYDSGYYDEDVAKAIALYGDLVCVTGYSKGEDTDFDYATVCYDKAGKMEWVMRYDGYYSEDKAKAITVDDKYVYVTGHSKGEDTDFDYATVWYDKSDGTEKWVKRYDGYYSEDAANAIAVDDMHVYVTGYSKGGETDFDYLTISYDKSDGDRKGLARYDGFYKEDKAQAIAVDGSSVWVTGYSDGDHSDFDYVTIKYSTEKLAEMWVARFDGYYDDDPYTMK